MLKRVVRAVLRLLSDPNNVNALQEGMAIDDGGFAVVVGERT